MHKHGAEEEIVGLEEVTAPSLTGMVAQEVAQVWFAGWDLRISSMYFWIVLLLT